MNFRYKSYVAITLYALFLILLFTFLIFLRQPGVKGTWFSIVFSTLGFIVIIVVLPRIYTIFKCIKLYDVNFSIREILDKIVVNYRDYLKIIESLEKHTSIKTTSLTDIKNTFYNNEQLQHFFQYCEEISNVSKKGVDMSERLTSQINSTHNPSNDISLKFKHIKSVDQIGLDDDTQKTGNTSTVRESESSTVNTHQTNVLSDSELLEQEKFKGTTGWLALVIFQLCVGLIFSVVSFTKVWEIINDGVTIALFSNSTNQFYQPTVVNLLFGELFFQGIMIVWYSLQVFLFFKRKRLFPILQILLLTVRLLFVIIDSSIASSIIVNGKQLTANIMESSDFYNTAAAALVWIPYFLVSKRVKYTFIE